MFLPCRWKAYKFNWQLEWLRSHLWPSLCAWLGCAETEPLAGVKLEYDLKPFFSAAAFLSGCKSNSGQKPKPSGKSMTEKNGLRRQSPSILWGLSSPIGLFWKPWRTICWKTRLESVACWELTNGPWLRHWKGVHCRALDKWCSGQTSNKASCWLK